MKKEISVIVVLAFLLLSGCNLFSKKEIVEFPSVKQTTLSEVGIPNILALPINLIVLNDKIIVNDMKTEWVFKIFSKESFEFKGDLVRRGRGPMEEVNVSPYFRRYGDDAFLFQGAGAAKVASLDFQDGDLNLVVNNVVDLPVGMYDDHDLFLLNDKLYSSITIPSTTRDFRCYDLKTESVYEWGELLALQRPKSLQPGQFNLSKYSTVKPDQNLLAVVYQNFPILRIYCSKSASLLTQLHMADGSNNIKFFERNLFEEGFLTYYTFIKSTEEFIYALYSGTGIAGEGENIPDFASVIHIWKWDGTPVMKLELDRLIFSFDVTPDNKQLIASSIVDVDYLFVTEIPWD